MGNINVGTIELSDEQLEILKEVKKSLKEKGQAAVLLRPGGGKSYVSAKLIMELCAGKKEYNVLWISTPTSISNTKSLLSGSSMISDKITYVTFNELALNSCAVDRLGDTRIKLIVIDEAHQALALQTYKGIQYTLKKYQGAKILAMTATKRRYSDRKKTFEWLTPKLVAGADYKDRGLKYSIENNLVCDFTYKVCDIQRIKEYCSILKDLQEKYSAYSVYTDLLRKCEELVNDYTENLYQKLAIQMRKDLVTDGSDGDRWFVFYKRIQDLKGDIENVRSLFKQSYSNESLTINIIEFHSDIDNDEETVKLINSAPAENTVDVILTCNKGSQSLHPDHTRGIIMNRSTGSETILEQQLGRCMINRDRADDNYCAIIYDCVNNKDSMLDSKETKHMHSGTPLNRFMEADVTSSQLARVSRKMGNCFDIETMDEYIAEVLEKFEYIKETYKAIELANDIGIIMCAEKGHGYRNFAEEDMKEGKRSGENKEESVKPFNPYTVLKEYDKAHSSDYMERFELMQEKFLSGYFGNTDSGIGSVLKDTLGDSLYITRKTRITGIGENEVSFMSLKETAGEVAYYDYDYTNRISRTRDLKNKIRLIRRLGIEGKLCDEFRAYCINNKIDINGQYTNLINEVLTEYANEDTTQGVILKFKNINKALHSLRENKVYEKYAYIDVTEIREAIKLGINTESVDIEEIDKLYGAIAKMQVFEVCYGRTNFGQKAVTALKLTYDNELSLKWIVTGASEYDTCTHMIRAIYSAKRSEKDGMGESDTKTKGALSDEESALKKLRVSRENAIKSLCRLSNIQYDKPIVQLQLRAERGDELSKYELCVLSAIGLNIYSSRRNKIIQNLTSMTYFGRVYKLFIEEPLDVEYKFLQSYIKENEITEHMKKMLNTVRFKECRNRIESKNLFKADNSEVIGLIKSFIYENAESAEKIKKAVKNKEVDGRKLIQYTLPDKLVNNNKRLIDSVLSGDWNSIDEETKKQLYGLLRDCSNGYDIIIENLLSYGMIPENQIQLARDILDNA